MKGTKLTLIAVAMVLALALAAPVYAQDSSVDGYSTQGSSIQDEVGEADAASGGGDGGSLPFTGLDLGFIAIAGGVLLATGFGMRRLISSGDGPARST